MSDTIFTSRAYTVSGPDSDGELELEHPTECGDSTIWLDKSDLEKMLALFKERGMSNGRNKLIAQMLEEYSERLGNDGCNDWECPEYLTKAEKAKLRSDLAKWSGDPDFPLESPPNWAVASCLAA